VSDAPFPEEPGYVSFPSYVKKNPKNNRHYIDGFKEDPAYDVLNAGLIALETVVPGFNITQIKEKFGECRFYINVPTKTEKNIEKLAYEISSAVERVVTKIWNSNE